MKFTILQKKLKEGLDIVERLSGKSLTLPILNNMLVSVQKNFLNLATTDLETGIRWWSLAKIEEIGEAVIPTKILSNLVNYLPDKPILFGTKDKLLSVECDNYKTQINYFNSEEYPIIPVIKEGEIIGLNNLAFCKSLATIANIPQPSPARPEISGVYVSFQKNLVRMAATDSIRLGEKKLFLEKALEKDYNLIIPQKTVKELIGVLADKKGELKVFISPNQIMFEFPMEETSHPQIQLISRLIEGEYPHYEDVIPKPLQGQTTSKSQATVKTQIIMQRKEFLNQIKGASIFSGRVNIVKFKISPKKEKIEVLSQNPELGDYQSTISANIKGAELEVAFDHRFLVEGISNIESSEIMFELSTREGGEDGPGILKPVGDQSYTYVVMPIEAN